MSFHAMELRARRYSNPGYYYLITSVTKYRRRLFNEYSAARILIQCLRNSDQNKYSSTIGFVVMPDHFHWLIQLGEIRNLSDTVGFVKGTCAHRINCFNNEEGAIWQHGFHDHAIRNDEDIAKVMRYVIANPLRAGLVDSIGDYPHWDCIYL